VIRGRLERLRIIIGWRGFFLLAIGIFDLVWGWTRLIHPDPVIASSQQLQLIGQLFSFIDGPKTILTWGYLWWLTGVICIIHAFRRDDMWGYGAAMGIKVSWIGANWFAWKHGLVGGGGTVAIWTFILIVVTGLAWRPETVRTDALVDSQTGEIPRIQREDDSDGGAS
jgi:hypothetical protein